MILVPGILGTELVAPATGEPVWGLRPQALASALLTGRIYDQLRNPELKPGRLLRISGSLPILGRFEPYTSLANAIRLVVAHPDALLEYPYDWRRPVSDVGRELAVTAVEHLKRWRQHSQGSAEARLTLVGHSMGGLICQYATVLHRDTLTSADVRQVLTLGTPFLGAVKAVRALASGEVLPFGWAIRRRTKDRLQALAFDTPAVHDLLPAYPCVQAGAQNTAPERPDLQTLVAAGTNSELTRNALDSRDELDRVLRDAGQNQVPFHALVGVGQPTLQSFRVSNGETTFEQSVGGINWAGDSTVHFHSAYPRSAEPATGLPQNHGAVAKSEEAISFVRTKLLGGAQGPWQGAGIGLNIADSAARGEPVTIEAVQPTGSDVTCTWHESATGLTGHIDVGSPQSYQCGDGAPRQMRRGVNAWNFPGLYTVTLSGGGSSDVSRDILIEDES